MGSYRRVGLKVGGDGCERVRVPLRYGPLGALRVLPARRPVVALVMHGVVPSRDALVTIAAAVLLLHRVRWLAVRCCHRLLLQLVHRLALRVLMARGVVSRKRWPGYHVSYFYNTTRGHYVLAAGNSTYTSTLPTGATPNVRSNCVAASSPAFCGCRESVAAGDQDLPRAGRRTTPPAASAAAEAPPRARAAWARRSPCSVARRSGAREAR